MAIQHASIPDSQLHEPKGVVTATQNSSYFANGSGSGVWKKVGTETLKGLSGDGGNTGLKLVTDGTNGFVLRRDAAYGAMVINNNTANFAVTAAADSTLNTDTDYALFSGGGAPWTSENLFGITFNTERLIVPVNGVYRIDFWASVKSFPNTAAKLSVKYRINGTTFSTRHPVVKSNSAGDEDQLTGFGLIQLNANDYLQLYLASTHTGNVVFSDVNTTLSLVRQVS